MHCARCGEEITVPYFYQGKPYGWTCIRMVVPAGSPHARKQQVKTNWVKADSFTEEINEKGHVLIRAQAFGKRVKYLDLRLGDKPAIYIDGVVAYIDSRRFDNLHHQFLKTKPGY